MPEDSRQRRVRGRIDEARAILRALGLPPAQQNDRTALVLLAFLDMTPDTRWSKASAPLRGIRPAMDFVAAHWGVK
jgi:hypothetical protein